MARIKLLLIVLGTSAILAVSVVAIVGIHRHTIVYGGAHTLVPQSGSPALSLGWRQEKVGARLVLQNLANITGQFVRIDDVGILDVNLPNKGDSYNDPELVVFLLHYYGLRVERFRVDPFLEILKVTRTALPEIKIRNTAFRLGLVENPFVEA